MGSKIIINGETKEFIGTELTYRDAVDLAFGKKIADLGYVYSITVCYRGTGEFVRRDCCLSPNQSDPVENGMIIHVCDTSNA